MKQLNETKKEIMKYLSKPHLNITQIYDLFVLITGRRDQVVTILGQPFDFDLCLKLEDKLSELYFVQGLDACESLAFIQSAEIVERLKQSILKRSVYETMDNTSETSRH